MKSILIALVSLFLSLVAHSQVNWFAANGPTTGFADVVVCDTATFQVFVSNQSLNAMTNNKLSIDLPSFIEYVPGSIQETSAPTNQNVQEFNVTNLNIPVFQFNSLSSFQSNASFKYRVKAKCGASTSSAGVLLQLNYTQNGNNLVSSPTVNGSNIINLANVNKPTLNIVNISPSTYTGNVGDSYVQTVTIRNAGLGALDGTNADVFARIVLDSTSCLSISNPSLGILSGDTLSIPSSSFPSGDAKWSNNEDLIVTYSVKVNCCSNPVRSLQTAWGCDAQACELSTVVNSNIVISNTVPNMSYVSLRGKRCYNGVNPIDTIMIINSGSGPSTELLMHLSFYIPGSGSSISEWGKDDFKYIDGDGNLMNIDTNSVIFNPSYTAGACYMTKKTNGEVDVKIPGYVKANDTAYLVFKTNIMDVCKIAAGNSCWVNGDYCSYASLEFESLFTSYKDQCGGGFNNSSRQTLGSPYYSPAINNVTGPTDVVDGQHFNLKLNYTFVRPQKGIRRLYMDVKMDPCFTLTANPKLKKAGTGVETSLSYVKLSDTIYRVNLSDIDIYDPDKVILPLKLTCGVNPCTGAFGFTYYWNPDTVCSCPIKIYCNSFAVTPHCGGCTNGGATPISAELRRTSLGVPDNNNDGLPDSTAFADLSKIEYGVITGGDTVELTQIVKVYPNPSGINAYQPFSHIMCEINTNTFDYWDPIGAVTAEVYPANGGAMRICNGTLAELSPGIFKYVIASCDTGFNGNVSGPYDSVVIRSRFVTSLMKTNQESNLGTEIWDLDLYSTYTATPNATYIYNTPPGDRYTCDFFNASITLMGWALDSYFPTTYMNGCGQRTLVQYNRFDINGNNSDNNFPYEYRSLGISDSFVINLPPGFVYENGSAQFVNYDYGLPSPSNVQAASANPVAINGNLISGYQLIFTVKDKYTTYGGTIKPTDESFWNYISLRVQPTCVAPVATPINIANYTTISRGITGNFNNVENLGVSQYNAYYFGHKAEGTGIIISNTAQPFIAGGGIINTFRDTATGNFVINNLSNAIPMEHSWVYILPLTPNSTVIEVTDSAGNVYSPMNGYYHFDTINASGTKKFNIKATTNSCEEARYAVYTGFDCIAYPSTPVDTSISCLPKSILRIVTFPSGTDAEIALQTPNANGTANLCEPFNVKLKMNASELADLKFLKNEWFIPFGYSPIMDSIKIEYPVGTGFRTPSNLAVATFGNGLLNFSLNSLDLAASNGITGSYDTSKKEISVKVPLQSSCSSINGDFTSVRYTAVSACNDTLPRIVKITNPIIFAQASASDYSASPNGVAEDIIGCGSTTVFTSDISIPITTISALSQSSDSIFLTLPDFITFDSYNASAPGSQNNPTSQPSGPTSIGGSRVRYSWAMTAGLGTNDTIKMKFNYRFNYANYIVYAGVDSTFGLFTATSAQVPCGSINCNLQSINGLTKYPINIYLPEFNLNVNGSSLCYVDQYGAYVSKTKLEVCNTSTAAMPTTDTIKVDLYYDANNNGFFDNGTDVFIQQFNGESGLGINLCDTIDADFSVTLASYPLRKFIYVVSRSSFGSIATICSADAFKSYYLNCPPLVQSLGNFVWHDANANGLQDVGEGGINQVTVNLIDSLTGNIVAFTQTDGTGFYQFNNVGVGAFKVQFKLKTGYVFTSNVNPSPLTSTNNSDADTTTGETNYFTFTPGMSNNNVDAGMYQLANIGNYVWNDANYNGTQDPTEQSLANTIVKLYNASNTLIATDTTDANGFYSFENLVPSNYSLGFIYPTSYLPSKQIGAGDNKNNTNNDASETPTNGEYRTGLINLISGETDNTIDAAALLPAMLGNYVWDDLNGNGKQDAGEPGVKGITMSLYTVNVLLGTETYYGYVVTDSLGYYSFDNLYPNLYRVYGNKGTISSYIYTKIVGSADNGDNTNSDANMPSGYQNTLANPWAVSPNINIIAGETDTTIDFGVVQFASIGNYVWSDNNHNGMQEGNETSIPNTIVTLYNSIGLVIAKDTTDNNGNYAFNNLLPGNYTVGFIYPPNYLPTLQLNTGDNHDNTNSDAATIPTQGEYLTTTYNLISGEIENTIDAGALPMATLGDYVWEDLNGNGLQSANEPAIQNLRIELYEAGNDGIPNTGDETFINDTTSASNGFYQFTNLYPGKYFIVANKSNIDAANNLYAYTKAMNAGDNGNNTNNDVTSTTTSNFNALAQSPIFTLNANEHDSTLDVGMYKPASIGNYVWEDTNGDGLQGNTESGKNAVMVYLFDNMMSVIDSTSTSPTGFYAFNNLAPGNYQVGFAYPTNHLGSINVNAGDNQIDNNSDANPIATNGLHITNTINLTSGEKDTSIDAGIVPIASLGNYVWEDLNANGIQDLGELGIENVSIKLYTTGNDGNANTNDDVFVSSTTSIANGYYFFTNLYPNNYFVKASKANIDANNVKYAYTKSINGGDNANDTNNDVVFVSTKTDSIAYSTAFNLSANEIDSTLDIGLFRLGQIGNYVWEDANVNGVQDTGEKGIPNTPVFLVNVFGQNIDSTQTDSTGHYTFKQVVPGDYQVGFVLPPTYLPTQTINAGDNKNDTNSDIPQLTNNGMYLTGVFNIMSGEIDSSIDAGAKRLASLGDRVWNDIDKNGIQDNNEVGVAGITVTLYSATGQSIASTVTDAYGYYIFKELNPSNYAVSFTLPQNYIFTQSSGTSKVNASNSDVNPQSGKTTFINLISGEQQKNIDAGIYYVEATTASIGNFVWNDTDANGVQDAGEVGISGVSVSLYNSTGKIVSTTITDANGFYQFTNVTPSTYFVGFTAPVGLVFSPNNSGVANASNSDANITTGKTLPFVVNAGDNLTYIDAGLTPQASLKSSLGDKVWFDVNKNGIQDSNEPGVSSVLVTLYESDGLGVLKNTTTDVYGNYIFNNLDAGNYVIGFNNLPTDFRFTQQNAGLDSTKNSDVNTTTNKTTLIILAASQNNMTIDAGVYSNEVANTNSIGDKVWGDLSKDGIQNNGEPGIAGITVTLYDVGKNIISVTSTDADGFYLFPNLANGTYQVGFSNIPNGTSFTQPYLSNTDSNSDANLSTGVSETILLSGNTNNISIDAGIIQGSERGGTSTLGDKVWYDMNSNGLQEANEAGAPNVTVTLYEDDGLTVISSTTTNALGEYIFTDLMSGNYVIGFSNMLSGYTLSPLNIDGEGLNGELNSDAYTSGFTGIIPLGEGEDKMSIDLGLIPPTGTSSLGNFVWNDVNKNGLQDANEPGIPGISVALLNANANLIASTTTDLNGNYQFVGLTPSTYQILFSNLPLGYEFSTENIDALGINGTFNSDASTTLGLTNFVTLVSGENNTNLDAGIFALTKASLGDYVWNDANGNGLQDATEVGISGILVTLYDENGKPITSTITNPNGGYLFSNLDEGTYSLGFSNLPSGMIFTSQETDSLSNTGSNVNPITDRTSPLTLLAGTHNPTIDAGLKTPFNSGLGNYVWYDVNKDGLQDADEPALAGVFVTLYENNGITAIASAVTDGNGAYSFINLPAGNYIVGFSNVPQRVNSNGNIKVASPTIKNTSNDERNSDMGINGKTTIYTLAPRQYNPTIDAGFTFDFPLPPTFGSVNLTSEGCNVNVNWITLSEQNVSYFSIMRKNPTETAFSEVGQMKAIGNTRQATTYNFVDKATDEDIFQYQIKSHDMDDKMYYSATSSIQTNCNPDATILIYPNPVNDLLKIILPTNYQEGEISIIQTNGQKQKTLYFDFATQSRNIKIATNELSAGLYFVQLVLDGETFTYKITKE
jgi:protocatechuate 3,4-dioxygenase beta subunit